MNRPDGEEAAAVTDASGGVFPRAAAGLPDGATVLLAGVVGSHAYGLATDQSDVDHLGVHLAPAGDLFGLASAAATTRTYVGHDPDVAVHEVGKFCRLALAANPTVCELLWLDSWTVMSEAGRRLVELRAAFWSERAVRNAYLGYARSQLARVGSGPPHRRAKAARHTVRLVRSAWHVLTTGMLPVNMSGDADDLAALGRLGQTNPAAFADVLADEIAAVDATGSVLPEHPDVDAVNSFLVDVRRTAYRTGR